jgi:hypothetical protein
VQQVNDVALVVYKEYAGFHGSAFLRSGCGLEESLREMAGHRMVRSQLAQRRLLHTADLLGNGAARVEAAALGRVQRAGHISL